MAKATTQTHDRMILTYLCVFLIIYVVDNIGSMFGLKDMAINLLQILEKCRIDRMCPNGRYSLISFGNNVLFLEKCFVFINILLIINILRILQDL